MTRLARMRFVIHRGFPLSGSPRSLASHTDGTCVCVGLRDGGVAMFPSAPFPTIADGARSGEESPGPTTLPPLREFDDPVRALCHVRDDWWLVSRSGGALVWLLAGH